MTNALRNTDLTIREKIVSYLSSTSYSSAPVLDGFPDQELLVLPRTIAIEHDGSTGNFIEIGSRIKEERRIFLIRLYSTLRGDLEDLGELLFSAVHGSTPLYDYSAGYDSPSSIGTIFFEEARMSLDKTPTDISGKKVYKGTISFVAIVTRRG